ncbi:MAG: 23S rRNA (adenine(2503)-C(2))-methyltransferase RlmN [Magnetococcales bacterium]|nr:23S rRNA (adenine(2503)-C(2))-methyltransferase RlmN [Magnetococcales bacterium]
MTPPIPVTGLTRAELTDLVTGWGEKPFRARQLWSWLHVKLARDWAAMSDLARPFRARLMASCAPLRPAIRAHQVSADGTEKWLLGLADGQVIETVYIPEDARGTLCVSSQAGCSLNCPFCHTGRQGFARNLTSAEIVEQVLLARGELLLRARRVTNVVLMGMGEPLYNYDAVARAVHILMDDAGLAIGSRKITLSTAGVVPRLDAVGRELGVNLAISLHAAREEVRNRLVPLNRKYGLGDLRAALLNYPLKSGRRVTWEYVLLDGVNDRLDDARAFGAYLQGIPSKINLIPFNPWPGTAFRPSSPEVILRFQEALHRQGFVTVIRDSRGADIAAACGQLKGQLPGARPRSAGAEAPASGDSTP